MKFKIGDRVSFLNEPGGGIIKKLLNNTMVYVEIEDGFEIPVLNSELVKVEFGKEEEEERLVKEENPKMIIPPINGISRLILEKESSGQRTISKKHIKNEEVTEEIDLHIENLINHHKYMSNGEIIIVQLNYFQVKLEAAIRNNIPRIVFIHGVGNGVLKSEIRKILRNYGGISFFDASYSRYGFGATEVRIR